MKFPNLIFCLDRMIDLPFSQPFYQWLLGEEVTSMNLLWNWNYKLFLQASFDVADLKGIDPDIFKTVSHLQGIVHKKLKVDNDR